MKRWILAALALFATTMFAQADETGRKIAELMNAPYLVRVSSSAQIRLPNGQTAPQFGHGSGFVYVDDKGRCGIYTNNHVLGTEYNRTVWVAAYGDVAQGKKYAVSAAIVSRDPALDFGLVECPPDIQASGVSATLGSAEDIEVGREVYAAGYPNGIHSVRGGRIIAVASQFGPFHFTSDAHIQPGNSGGPMFVYAKEAPTIVGVNTAGGGKGFSESYTLNIEYIRRMIPMMWKGDPIVRHGSLNIWAENFEDAHPDLFQRLTNLDYPPKGDGLIVLGVEDGSTAARAGIEVGDVITGLAQSGVPIPFKNAREFAAAIVLMDPDEKVVLSGLRKGAPFEKTVALEDLPPMWE